MELGRLDELKKEVDAVNPASSTDAARAHAAMLGIINLLEDAPQQANERIRECHALLVQDKTSPMYSRWGDIALASLAIQHPFTNESINEFETAGRLRLQRKGPVIYYLIAKPDSEDFRLITQRPLGTQDIKHLAINADASDKASGAEFVVKSVSIRAAKLLKLK